MNATSERFYFTYGRDENMPYQGGWTEVVAPNYRAACSAFRCYHPDIVQGVLNCADVYSEEAFNITKMAGPGGSFGQFCHETITITRT